MPESDLGPRVIGERKAARYAEQKAALVHVLGPRVTGPVGGVEAPTDAASEAPTDGNTGLENELTGGETRDQYSIAQLTALLAEQPDELDRLIESEEWRPAPRLGAVNLFRTYERDKGEAARESVLDRLDALEQLIRGW